MTKQEMTAGEVVGKIAWALVLTLVLGIVYWECAKRLSLVSFVICYALGHIISASINSASRRK